jgi:hypothetical protein
MINFWFEKLLHHSSAILCGQFLSQSQQKLIFVPLSLLSQFSQSILQVLHRVVSQFEQKFDDILGVLLVVLSCYVHCCFYQWIRIIIKVINPSTAYLKNSPKLIS